MIPRTLLVTWLLCVVVVASALQGQIQQSLNSNNPSDTISLTSTIKLSRLVDLTASQLGVTIEYTPQMLSGKSVTLRELGEVPASELWALTNQLLATQGLTTVSVPGDRMYRVVQENTAARDARVELGVDGLASSPAGFRVVVVEPEHADPVRAIASLNSAYLGGTIATAVNNTGYIILSGPSVRVDEALALLRLIDVQGEPVVIRQVTARFLDADELVTRVEELVAKRAMVSGQELDGELMAPGSEAVVLVIAAKSQIEQWLGFIERMDRRDRVETRGYTPGAFTLEEVANLLEQTVAGVGPQADERWRIVQDNLTGTLFVTATPLQHERIEETLERLESLPSAARRPVRTYQIRNRDVIEVIEVLESLIDVGVIGREGIDLREASREFARRTAQQQTGLTEEQRARQGMRDETALEPATAEPPGRGVAQRTGEEDLPIVLTADIGTNTLIAIGEPRLLAQLELLLETLDVRQPQVMIEVMIVSINESQSLDLGVELQRIYEIGGSTVRLASFFGLGSVLGGDGSDVGAGNGLTGSVLDPGDFSALVRALETINDGRTVSRPYVLVGNNQPANFNSVLQQPFSSINSGDTVSTTSFGGTQDAGTTVTVTPQIASGDHVLLTYSASLSSFVGDGTDSLPPPRQQNSIDSVATVPDGHTVVVGGLELTTEGKSTEQVPLLGSIPVVGELFKNRSNQQSRTRFYVFIRPRVLRGIEFESLKHLSRSASSEAMIDDGWPEVRARLIR